MMTYLEVILSQCQMLCTGLILLSLRCLYTKEDITKIYPESIRHWGWYLYLATLWFIIFPYFIIRYKLPRFGIWEMAYKIDPLFGISALLVFISFGIYCSYIKKRDG